MEFSSAADEGEPHELLDEARSLQDSEEHEVGSYSDDGDSENDEGEEEDDSDEGEPMELDLDEHGRVSGTSDCGLDFNFKALMAPVLIENKSSPPCPSGPEILSMLRDDCEAVFGSENSFWLQAGDPPRCTLEQMAADIFAFHTKDLPQGFDLSSSGAEWWVQIRKQEDRGTTGSFIGFHWDKDEDLVDCSGICLHPQLSTVTYLCSTGAPTMICERTSPLQYDDHDELYSPANDFARAFISHPDCRAHESSPDNSGAAAALKHVAFDGRMLHSAPHEFTRPCLQQHQPAKDEAGSAKDCGRYTFLVNIWIGHEPLGLEPLEEEQLEQLSSLNLTLDLESAAECKRATVSAAPRSPLRPPFISNFGPTGIEHEVSFGHISELEDASARFCTLEVDLGAEDSQGRIRPSPMQRQSSDVAINAGSRQQQQQGKRKRSSDGDKAGDISLAYADFNDEDDDDSHDDGDGDDDAITLGR